MATQTFRISAGGLLRLVSVAPDSLTGRIVVRVDGHPFGKPLASREESRQIEISGDRFLLRRLEDGTFALDPVPSETMGPGISGRPPTKKAIPIVRPDVPAPASPLRKGLVAAASILGLVLLVWFSRNWAYWSAQWTGYTPLTRSFWVLVPAPPKVASKEIAFDDFRSTAMVATSTVAGREFAVLELDVPGFSNYTTLHDKVLNGTIEDFVRERGGTFVWRKDGIFNRQPGQEFFAEIPERGSRPASEVHGKAVCDVNSLYLVTAVVPKGDALGTDVTKFLVSFRLNG